ncbi:MAG: AsmA family protein, partial [Pacificimonas sp.]
PFHGPLGWTIGIIGSLAGLIFLLWLILFITKGRFLEGAFERYASNKLGRDVEVAGDFQLYSNPHIKFVAEGLTARNPDWAENDDLADIGRADLSIDIFRALFGDLLFRRVELTDAGFGLEWNEDGSANTWTFDQDEAEPIRLPVIRKADISGTRLRYRDPVMRLFAQVGFDRAEMSDSRIGEAIGFSGGGMSHGTAFLLSGRLQSPDATIAGGRNELSAKIEVGASVIDINGTLPGITELEGSDLNIRARGNNLMTPMKLLAITVPQTRDYDLRGDLTRTGSEWRFADISGTFGDSDIAGRLTIRTGGERVFIDGDLKSENLDIIDAGPWIGFDPDRLAAEGADGIVTNEGGRPHVLPDAPLDAEGLSLIDAKIAYAAASVKTGTIPISNLSVQLGLDNRLLTLTPLTFDLAGGTLTANIDLNARKSPVVTTYDITLSPVRLATLLKGFEVAEAGTTGTLRARIDLTGYGDSVRESLGSADGRAAFILPRGSLQIGNGELVELDIGDFLEAAISDDLKEPAAIRCGVVAFTFRKGVGQSDPIFIDTEKAVIRGGGIVSLRDESLDLKIEADAKNFSLFSGQSPVGIEGYMADPSIKPISGKLLGRAGAGIALGIVATPIAALAAFVDLGDEEDTDCRPVLAGASGAQVNAADEAAEE